MLSRDMAIHRLRVEQEAVDQLSTSIFQLTLTNESASAAQSAPTIPNSQHIQSIASEIHSLIQPCDRLAEPAQDVSKCIPSVPTVPRPQHPQSASSRTAQMSERSPYTQRALQTLKSIQNDMHDVAGSIAPEEMRQASHAFHNHLNPVRRVTPSIKALKDSVKKELDEFDSGIPPTNVLTVYNTGEHVLFWFLCTPDCYFTENHFHFPLCENDTVAQVCIFLAVVCFVVMGVSHCEGEFILGMTLVILRATFEHGGRAPSIIEEEVLLQIPTTIPGLLKKVNLDACTVTYAVCP